MVVAVLYLIFFSELMQTRLFNLHVNQKTNVVMLTAATSFMDMLSGIGGTLGLFTGFSILSGVEIVYWIYKAGKKKFARL